MSTYAGAQATAALLIAKKGTTVTLKRRTAAAFDPVTQVETSASVQSESFPCVVLPPSQQARFRVGSLENRNAVELYFSQLGQAMTPAPGDVVTVGAKDYAIFWAQTYDPAADGAILTLAYAE